MTAAKKKRTGKAAYEVSTHFFTAIVTGSCRWQTQLEEKEIRWGQRMKGRVAKYYLTDGRRHTDSEGYKTSVAFEKYLADCGLQVATDRDFGITALRWAGMKAGIGIIRKNNFFYTEKGSYQYLEAFLIDEPLQYIVENQIRPCAEKCNLCMRSCPTESLEAPYITST